jgi:hypothetical protein
MSFSAQLKYSHNADERSAERYRLLLPASAEGAESGLVDVTVHDLSTSGFLVETEAPLSVGSEITLDIPGVGSVAAEVAWSSGNFFGGQFETPLAPSSVSAAFAASRVVWPNFGTGSFADRAVITNEDFEAEAARDQLAQPVRASLPLRMRVILGASLLLWAPIGAAFWSAFA